jgi:4-hydroxyphenylpyruvate dioxygenase
MKTCIATVCVSGNLQEKLEAIAAAGFKAVEIFENDLIAFPGLPKDVRKICGDLGLTIVTSQPFRDFEGMPKERRQRTFDRAERKFDLLEELGTNLLFVCSSVSPEAEGGIDRLAADFAELGERASKRKMLVGFEALAWGKHIYDYRDAWEIVRRANHPSVGTILDTFHIQARSLDLTPIQAIPREKIFHVQIADAPRLQMDYLSWGRHWRCLPGQGDFDLGSFMYALTATGYDSYLSLEIFNDRFRAGAARSVAIDGHRSLICLMDDTSRRLKRPVSGSIPMPPPQAVQGVEFIEFAVDEVDRKPFESLLSQLGFAKTGKHRSKEVSLWKQGQIRIVINSEKNGFAHSYQITHGTSVCAIALKVRNASETIERATALLDVPHSGEAGPGELRIPGVRGLGGSLLYFVDDNTALKRWHEVDFVPTGDIVKGAGLTAVDHISQTMQYEEMLTWLLFYTSLFDATKTPSQAVLDPGGVVQSQVIESGIDQIDNDQPEGLRLVLNGSQSNRTMSARFVTDFFGSGVQHIALSTTNIQATVATLVANGVRMLAVPENYYDDLEARSDLSSAEIDQLKALNILYDRDASGPFWQAYTATLDGGFFFEFVQRDGYTGYGAPNAGIRLAAQARLARPASMPTL